ncbi:MAG: LicD family protein [Candidatus Neomarinimicrobiota bacterium]
MLLKTKNILEKNGIPFWLDSGTLLSLYRDQRILPNLKNQTVGIFSRDYEAILKLKAAFSPWYIMTFKYDRTGYEWIDGNVTKIYLVPRFTRRHKFGLNITLKFPHGDHIRWASGIACKQISADYFSNLGSLQIGSVSFPIPGNTAAYLTERYGDWKTPVQYWHTTSDDGAIISKEELFKLPRKTRWTKPKRFRKGVALTGKNLPAVKMILADTVAFLDEYNIRYWLDCGTLLGIIRNGDLLPWDHDADICIDARDSQRLLDNIHKLPRKYWTSIRHNYTGRLPGSLRAIKVKLVAKKFLRLLKHKELHLDIFVKYRFDEYYYWMDSHTVKRVRACFHDQLDTIDWENYRYKIPSDVETYLEERFGDWRTPVEKFDSSLDDLAIYEGVQYKPKTEGQFSQFWE